MGSSSVVGGKVLGEKSAPRTPARESWARGVRWVSSQPKKRRTATPGAFFVSLAKSVFAPRPPTAKSPFRPSESRNRWPARRDIAIFSPCAPPLRRGIRSRFFDTPAFWRKIDSSACRGSREMKNILQTPPRLPRLERIWPSLARVAAAGLLALGIVAAPPPSASPKGRPPLPGPTSAAVSPGAATLPRCWATPLTWITCACSRPIGPAEPHLAQRFGAGHLRRNQRLRATARHDWLGSAGLRQPAARRTRQPSHRHAGLADSSHRLGPRCWGRRLCGALLFE
jgi:hypothetical protein